MTDAELHDKEARFVIREWTSPVTGQRIRFRRRDAIANLGRRVLITSDPGNFQVMPEAVGKITAATATDGHLTVTVEVTGGALTVGFARFLTDHPEGAGAAVIVTPRAGGRDVKEIRSLYPLPARPATDGPQCSPDCPHHAYPDGAAAKSHQRNRDRVAAARPHITEETPDGF